jgi:hypothetical protein
MATEFTRDGLAVAGFTGFQSIANLNADGCSSVPFGPGVYVLMRENPAPVRFLGTNPGGRFKGRDPTDDIALLKGRWISDTAVIYIGKADALRRRLRQYLAFGSGRPVGHWGGRFVWQLQGSSRFLVAWREAPAPLRYEAKLLGEFTATFGSLPFANLRF